MSGGKSQMQQTAVCYHAQLPLFLQQLAQTPPVQRLRQVGMSCGCEYTQFPPFVHSTPYSRYEHSLGVALIVWHFTGNRAQAAAGLLHDAATPTFAHVVDFLLGDHLRQEATEAGTHDVLAASAPRLVCVGSALNDMWSSPQSQYACCMAASPAWRLLGRRGFVHPQREAQPGDDFAAGEIGYHLRLGTHFFSRHDWNSYMNFLDGKRWHV